MAVLIGHAVGGVGVPDAGSGDATAGAEYGGAAGGEGRFDVRAEAAVFADVADGVGVFVVAAVPVAGEIEVDVVFLGDERRDGVAADGVPIGEHAGLQLAAAGSASAVPEGLAVFGPCDPRPGASSGVVGADPAVTAELGGNDGVFFLR